MLHIHVHVHAYAYMENGKKCNVYYNDSLQEKQWMKK